MTSRLCVLKASVKVEKCLVLQVSLLLLWFDSYPSNNDKPGQLVTMNHCGNACDAGVSGVALVFWKPCLIRLLMACIADEKTTDLSPATEGRWLALLSFSAFETWGDKSVYFW